MRVVIIENEKLAAERLQYMLLKYNPSIEVVAILQSINNSLIYFEDHALPDLLLMDIELGDGNSFEIIQKTGIGVPIIFITAYEEHALKAFKLNSVDYLLKPLIQSELNAALVKFRKKQPPVSADTLTHILQQLQSNKVTFKTRFLIKSGTRLITMNTAEVAFFFVKEGHNYIQTTDNLQYLIDENLDELEKVLNPHDFFRVNRQFMVHYNSIAKLHVWFDGKLKLQLNPAAYEEIVVSRLRAHDFKKWLNR